MNKPTIFLLAGGNDRAIDDYGKRLKDEITKYVSQPKILSCFFTAPEGDWPARYQDWKDWFAARFGDNLTYDYAKKDAFLQQIDRADVIYLHGGNTQRLFDALPDVNELKKHFRGKVIVGSSAGANVLSKNYWSSSRAGPARGLGILDMNIMVHYGALNHEGRPRMAEDWAKEEAEFQKFVGVGKVTHLPEGQFIVKQVDI